MDFLNTLLGFFTNKEIPLVRKTSIFGTIIFSLLVIDYLYPFSEFQLNKAKIEQIEKIETLKSNPQISSDVKKQLASLETDIINKRHYRYIISDFATGLFDSMTQASDDEQSRKMASYSYDLLLIITVIIIYSYVTSDTAVYIKRFIGLIAVLLALSVFNYWICLKLFANIKSSALQFGIAIVIQVIELFVLYQIMERIVLKSKKQD